MRIGLELHVSLPCKLFKNQLFDLAIPGILPVLNPHALVSAHKIAKLVSATHLPCNFTRKHYTYPDIPHGFQITQTDRPFARDGTWKAIAISQLQLEQDTARQLAQDSVDYSRAGDAVVELVTPPAFNSIQQVTEWIKSLTRAIAFAGIS